MTTKIFTWNIRNFSEWEEETVRYSALFLFGGSEWMISAKKKDYPDDYGLSMFLCYRSVDREKNDCRWGIFSGYRLSVVDQLNGSSTLTFGAKQQFAAGKGWGFEDRFIRRLIHDDSILIEARVSTLFASKNVAADHQLSSSVTCGVKNSTSGSLVTPEMEKLSKFFDMSVEGISEANAFDNVETTVVKISEQETDSLKKIALKNVRNRVAEFKQSIPKSVTMIQASVAIEISSANTAKELEGKLVKKQKQIRVLESNISRVRKEEAKLETEIQLLLARKDKMTDARNAMADELEEIDREASREAEELKKQMELRDRAGENKMRAEEKLAQSNASWKLFKGYMGL